MEPFRGSNSSGSQGDVGGASEEKYVGRDKDGIDTHKVANAVDSGIGNLNPVLKPGIGPDLTALNDAK